MGKTIVIKGPPLSSYKVPPYKYFPTNLMESEGPKHWAQLRFLQACERIQIPSELWPWQEFRGMKLPREYGYTCYPNETLRVPPFNPLYESEAEWRTHASQELDKFLDRHATLFRGFFQPHIALGTLTKIKSVREAAPLELRYEWAARRHCLKEQYKAMSSDDYSSEQIRKTVSAILAEVGLKQRK